MRTSWTRVWPESAPGQRKRGGCGMLIQRRDRNGDAAPADLLLGFEPITECIALPSGLPALLENLIRPLADLQMRTDADHGFLLPVRLSVGTPAPSKHFKDLSCWIRPAKDFCTRWQRHIREGWRFEYSFLSLRESFSSREGARRRHRYRTSATVSAHDEPRLPPATAPHVPPLTHAMCAAPSSVGIDSVGQMSCSQSILQALGT